MQLVFGKIQCPDTRDGQIPALQDQLVKSALAHGIGFGTGCRVLKMLLRAPQGSLVGSVIPLVDFLCDSWWEGVINDGYVSGKVHNVKPLRLTLFSLIT